MSTSHVLTSVWHFRGTTCWVVHFCSITVVSSMYLWRVLLLLSWSALILYSQAKYIQNAHVREQFRRFQTFVWQYLKLHVLDVFLFFFFLKSKNPNSKKSLSNTYFGKRISRKYIFEVACFVKCWETTEQHKLGSHLVLIFGSWLVKQLCKSRNN